MERSIETSRPMQKTMAVRFQGKWYGIAKKQYEPERQTYEIAWNQIQNNKTPQEAYREWFLNEQKNAKLLYPSFRKDA